MKFFIKQLRNKFLGGNFIISEIYQKIEKEKESLISDINNVVEINSNKITRQIENITTNNSKIIIKEIESKIIDNLDDSTKQVEDTFINNINIFTKEVQNTITNNSDLVIKQVENYIENFSNTFSAKIFDYFNEEKKSEFEYIKSENINIVFFIQHPTVWNSLKSVYLSMQKNPKINISIVLIPFIHGDASTSKVYFELKDFFIQENIPFINYNFYDLQKHKPHIIFVQNPYEETRPDRFRISEILKYGGKICYIPYGLDIGGGIWNIQSQFNLDIHKISWKIFVRSKKQKLMYAKYCDAGSSHVIVTGHPKFDNQKISTEIENKKLLDKINGRKLILWTPHFSVGNPPSWSTYNIYQKTIFEEFNKRKDLFLYIRPHPLFFKAMKNNNIFSNEDEINFKKMIDLSDNMALDENADYLESFSISDALMADAGSFLLEYLPSLKPILYLHHPDGLGLYDESLEKIYYKAINEQNIIDFIDMISKSNDFELEKRKNSIPDYLFGLDENIGDKIVEHIINAFDKGDFYTPSLVEEDFLQNRSLEYWQNATNGFLTPDDDSLPKEKLLDSLCQSMKFNGNAIDIGCGNGTFTFLLAKYFKEIDAYDASYSMICQAKDEQILKNIDNIEFFHAQLKDMKPFKKYNLVSCMDVTSTFSDDLEFLKILKSFKMLIKDNGYLLLIDSLSLIKEQLVSDDMGYVAKYRNISDYKYLVEKNGFELIEEHQIKVVLDKNLTNNIFIFKCKEN